MLRSVWRCSLSYFCSIVLYTFFQSLPLHSRKVVASQDNCDDRASRFLLAIQRIFDSIGACCGLMQEVGVVVERELFSSHPISYTALHFA
jgi:hypothetical protein